MNLKWTFLLLAATLFFACKSPVYQASSFPKERIELGEGGGFTGNYTTYVILPNRQVFAKFDYQTEFVEAPPLSKKEYKKIKKEIKSLRIEQNDTVVVGNMNRFIRVFAKDTFHEIYWSFESNLSKFDTVHHRVMRLLGPRSTQNIQ